MQDGSLPSWLVADDTKFFNTIVAENPSSDVVYESFMCVVTHQICHQWVNESTHQLLAKWPKECYNLVMWTPINSIKKISSIYRSKR
ncbi:uncharacterized protein G2W53_004563 [Senna tora]|uniref:Uncharacterized protein n=1 Tax=Senna tora TaxID=362788 RepID=A0A835CJG8_9FABA|nr:uncharacterized protein G2W53_004563 [Senna tora]